MMLIAKRARTMPSADRIKVVEKAVRFHEVMSIVQFHHAGCLKSFEADAVDQRDAIIARLHRAMDIMDSLWLDHNTDRHEIELEGARRIREFAPEFVPDCDSDLSFRFRHVIATYQAEYARAGDDAYLGKSRYVRPSMAVRMSRTVAGCVDRRIRDRVRAVRGLDASGLWFFDHDRFWDALNAIRVFAPELIEAASKVRLQIESVSAGSAWVE